MNLNLKSKNLAPILVFTYNRIEHFKKTIDSLQSAKLSNESTLVIISDGPKNEFDRTYVEQIRDFSKNINGFKNVIFEFNEKNKGALWNLKHYELKYLEQYNEIIFLEDDNIIHEDTLVFLNESLIYYKDEPSVFSISAYSIPIEINTNKSNYFLPWFVPWVCATWKEKFIDFDWNTNYFSQNIKNLNRKKVMKDYGHFFFESAWLDNKGYSYALDAKINMHLFKNNMVTVCPSKSLVMNIGNDGSGINAGKSDKFNTDNNFEIDQPFKFEKFIQLDHDILKAQKLFLDETIENKILLRRFYYFLGFYFPLIKRFIRKHYKN